MEVVNKIRVAIIGGAGYTAGELLRLMVVRSDIEIVSIVSRSHASRPIGNAHADLAGITDLVFDDSLSEEPIDYLFLCSGHGASRSFLEENLISEETSIIDLSTDFRHRETAEFDGRGFVYGLPELAREEIRSATAVANPGCFATAIQLALLPLASEGLLVDDVHVHAITGSTGAGASPSPTTHFSWRESNVSVYRPFTHQHLTEIEETLDRLQPERDGSVRFIPIRGTFTRGIHASLHTRVELPEREIIELYHDYYADHPFTLVDQGDVEMKSVVNTNYCRLGLTRHDDLLLVTSAIDNLLKGASGQAMQNMNLMSGSDETKGLLLKASAF